MVRILDIAAEVGVSRSLVSKVLSGHMGTSTVRPEIAERIRAVARERGFVPNAAARSLHSGRQDVVSVFVSRHGAPEQGMDITIVTTAKDNKAARALLEGLGMPFVGR